MDIQIIASSSAGNLYRVDDLLIDPGVPIRKIKEALGFGLSKITACLVSHEHGDHARSAADLLKAGVNVWCSEGTGKALNLSGHRIHMILEAGKQVQIASWAVLPFDTQHDSAEPLGFLLAKGREKVLYAVDTNYLKYRFRGLTHILLGVNHSTEILERNMLSGHLAPEVAKRTLRNHMSLKTALDFFRANDMSRVETIYLLHLSDGNSDETAFKAAVEKVTGRPVIASFFSPGGLGGDCSRTARPV